MHLLFMDESGTPPKPGVDEPRYFVVAGVIIPEGTWHALRDGLMGLKIRHRVRGELKWRYFAPANDDARNPMRALSQAARDEIRSDVYKLLATNRTIRTIACVVSSAAAYDMASVNDQQDIYHLGYKGVTERFQYHLQDLSREIGRKQYGIVVADHRGSNDDKLLRQVHQKLLHSRGEFISTYGNLIEGLFLEPSHLSVGIQLADLAAGAVWRKFERSDETWFAKLEGSFRRSPAGAIEGYGLVKSPKAGWR
ncbi:MAG TPA: DUF3800 domain-containing protein [Allosphingosinicella sp.]|nr:DUF3800 domain-containing protein [Allosphingosinicella sp.]